MIIEEKSKRCSNCYRYPFCIRCNSPQGICDGWQSKFLKNMEYELKKILKKGNKEK